MCAYAKEPVLDSRTGHKNFPLTVSGFVFPQQSVPAEVHQPVICEISQRQMDLQALRGQKEQCQFLFVGDSHVRPERLIYRRYQ